MNPAPKPLATVTPSFLPDAYRSRMAQEAYRSFRQQAPPGHPHYVVDDTPAEGRRPGLIERFRAYEGPDSVYAAPGIRLTKRGGGGMTTATLDAVRQAIADGAELIFIHLDDCVYNDTFADLLRWGVDAMSQDPDLVYVRTGGYPLLHEASPPRLGNRAKIQHHDGTVTFDDIRLRALRRPEYTLWWSDFHERANGGAFWPLPMWHVIYQARFLLGLLELGDQVGTPRLGDLEAYFKRDETWPEARRHLRGRFGFINMQFGGWEIHRTRIWKRIGKYANDAIHPGQEDLT